MRPDSIMPGILEKWQGIRSTRPSLMASLATQPENTVFSRYFWVFRASRLMAVPQAEQLDQGKVLQVAGAAFHQMLDQGAGLGHGGAQKDVHTRFDLFQGRGR